MSVAAPALTPSLAMRSRRFRSGQPPGGPLPRIRPEPIAEPAAELPGLANWASPWNQQMFDRLKLSLRLDLRRQVFVAVCDDSSLRDRLARRLVSDLAISELATEPGRSLALVDVDVEPGVPDFVRQAAAWQARHAGDRATFQVLGIDRLMRQPARSQRLLLQNLTILGTKFSQVDASWLLWLSQPWLHVIRQSAGEFWRWHTGIFEFEDEPIANPGPNSALGTVPSPVPLVQPVRPQAAGVLTVGPIAAVPLSSAQPVSPGPDGGRSLLVAGLTVLQSAQPPSQELQSQPLVSQETRSQEPPSQEAPSYETPSQASAGQESAGQEPTIEPDLAPTSQSPAGVAAGPTAMADPDYLWPDAIAAIAESYLAQARQAARLADGAAVAQANLIEAREAIEQAIGAIAERQPQDTERYRLWQHDLGMICADLARYDEPVVNLERAIVAYEVAIEDSFADGLAQSAWVAGLATGAAPSEPAPNRAEVDRCRSPQWYASALNNLGTAHWNLAQHQPGLAAARSLRAAISAYERALACYVPDPAGMSWPRAVAALPAGLAHQLAPDSSYGTIQANRATAYLLLAQYDSRRETGGLGLNCLQEAIASCEIALNYRPLSDRPAAYAATQNNLGTAWAQLADRLTEPEARHPARQAAIAACEAALSVDRSIPVGFDRAATAAQLAHLRYQWATDPTSDLSPEAAIELLHQSLADRVACLQGWQNQGDRHNLTIYALAQTVNRLYQLGGVTAQARALAAIPAHWVGQVLACL